MPNPLSRVILVAVSCCLCSNSSTFAADPPPPAAPTPQEKAQLDALVTRLSDDDWKAREKAQQDLTRFGPGAAPRLKEVLAGAKDPELRTRVEAILKLIEQNDATGPTFVTLHLSAAPAALAFDELARQAGAKLETNPPGLLARDGIAPVTIDADRQPFWDVLRKLCGTCGVRPERSGGGKLLLTGDDGSWARRPAVLSGPFLVTANEAFVTRGVRFGAPKAAANPPPRPDPRAQGVFDHAQVQLEAFFEPKLHGAAWSPGNVVSARDAGGLSLVIPRGAEPRRRSTYGPGRTGEWEATVWLAAPDRGARVLAALNFNSTFTVQTGIESIELLDVLNIKDVERTVGPARITVQGVTRLGEDELELRVKSVPAGDVQAWRGAVSGQFRRGPRLLDAEGREWMQAGGGSSMSATEYSAQTRFNRPNAVRPGAPADPVKLVWDLPTGVQQFEVPVEFKDLELP